MNKHFWTFLLYLFPLSSLSSTYRYPITLAKEPKASNMRLLSSSSGDSIPLTNRNPYMYLDVQLYGQDLGNWDSASTAATVPMMLALYSSQSLLSNPCLNFYNCDYIGNPDVLNDDFLNTTSVGYPYFEVQDYFTSNSFSISSEGLYFPGSAIIATSCNTSSNISYGAGVYGLIGMGTQGQSLGSFSPVFSIYFEEDSSNGELIVGIDSSYAESKALANVIVADSNWHVHNIDNIAIGSYSQSVNMSLIFDVNSNAVGFPIDIFHQIVDSIANSLSISCSNDTYLPKCAYVGEIHDFPDLEISIGEEMIVVPSEVYVFEGYEEMTFLGSVVLNLQGLSPNFTNQSYVTPEYSNYIIFGYPMMSNYYTIFSSSSGNQITLYTVDRTDYVTIYILIGNGGLLIVLGLCYFITSITKKSDADQEDSDPKQQKDSKLLKKGRRAGVMTASSAASPVNNRDEYKNVGKKEKLQVEVEVAEQASVETVPAADLSPTRKKEDGPVKEFELTQISLNK